MQKPASIIFLFAALLVAGAGCSSANPAPAFPPVVPPSASTPPPAAEPATKAGVYENKKLGFSFTYPSDIFTASTTSNGVDLVSKYYVVDNPSGIPEKETKHYFSISFTDEPIRTIEMIKKVFPYAFSQPTSPFHAVFPDATEESFTPSPGFAVSQNVDGKKGYRFTFGLEGINTDYLFISQVNYRQTLEAKFSYITDFLKDNIKPGSISEAEQMRIFDEVMASVRFD